MDEQRIEQLLEENKILLEENNAILKKLHGYQKWARFMNALYWLIILGSIFGAYFFVQQYLTDIGVSPDTIRTLIENPNQLFLKGIKSGVIE